LLNAENQSISDWLLKLTDKNLNWGFGLCFLYLRNVKGYRWNHKRVYRIYKELAQNLRIKPRKRLKREKPDALIVPMKINQVWSMDFMHDQLQDCRSFRLFNVIDDFNRESFVERLNLTVRYEWLLQYHWQDLDEVRLYATQWMWRYNNERPNMALGGITPIQRLAMAA
jgi:putative transposase